MNVGMISYTAGAVCFFVLLLLLLTSWRGRLQGALLVGAVFVTLLWAALSAYYAGRELQELPFWYHLFEVMRSGAWLAFLFQLLRPLTWGKRTATQTLRFLYPGLLMFAALVLVADLFPEYVRIDIRILGHISLAVIGLALIEQLFRNTRAEQRWATKFLYLGIGALFAYDFFLYADALLFKRIDAHVWYARGLVNAMVVPLIAVSAARNPHWSLDVFVSRRMVIHSASIFGAGLYLLVMAGAGYYIRLYGGTWGTVVQLAFVVGAGLLLLVLTFSGQWRAYMKVALSKHFFSYKYDYREEWLKFISTLSASGSLEPLQERAIHVIAEIVHSPGGILWTRGDNDNYYWVATWNMGDQVPRNESGDSSLVTFLKRRQWIIELDEYQANPKHYAGLNLPDWLKHMPRAWIVVPLMEGDGLRGFIVLARPRVKQQINWEDYDLLKTAGRQVAGYVALLDTTNALMDARQFEAFNRLSAYLVHDLKNITAQLSLVVTNAARHKNNPAFVDDAIHTVANATAKINRMLEQLRKGNPLASELKLFTLDAALREVIKASGGRQPVPSLGGCDLELVLYASRDRFMVVLEHLIQNAQEATTVDGRVEVNAYRDGSMAVIEIDDNGCGMDERFIRERLFRPFNTTKGNAGMGIGVYESREFMHSLGGEIDVVSKPNVGTTFFLRFPLAEAKVGFQDSRRDVEVVSCASQARSY